jgi:putative restriction endonuclease
MASGRRLWTRPELIEVLKLYCLLPFGQLHSRNAKIVALAHQLGRTSSALALKLVNFASLDPTIDRKGMENASALDRQVWNEFFADIGKFVIETAPTASPGFAETAQSEYLPDGRQGLDVIGSAKRRVNQSFFRSMILASYDAKCAMTGISDQRLLVASHIDRWADNPAHRLDPHNGLCLNSLHDRAFEEGLIAVAPDLTILYSSRLSDTDSAKIRSVSAPKLTLPARFKPSAELLEQHRLYRFVA